jgi:hypothetical protein
MLSLRSIPRASVPRIITATCALRRRVSTLPDNPDIVRRPHASSRGAQLTSAVRPSDRVRPPPHPTLYKPSQPAPRTWHHHRPPSNPKVVHRKPRILVAAAESTPGARGLGPTSASRCATIRVFDCGAALEQSCTAETGRWWRLPRRCRWRRRRWICSCV